MPFDIFFYRAQILHLIREWFRREEFLEVETPIMVKHPSMEPYIDVFSTEFISKDGKYKEKRYLQTSPEYAMKKLLAKGFKKIFQIAKVFRNGEAPPSQLHNPEFTMLEWYRTQANYLDIMNDTENMIRFVALSLRASLSNPEKKPQNTGLLRRPAPRNDILGQPESRHDMLLQESWERLSIRDAFQRFSDLSLDELRTVDSLQQAVEKKGYQLTTQYSWDDLFFLIMVNEIEPKLGFEKPCFLYDYPSSQAALSKKKASDPFWAERFELYIKGVELCNAFSELNDAREQRVRLEIEQEERRKNGKEVFALDEEFLQAVSMMPESGGNALGIDRLTMILLQKQQISEVLLFPWQ